MNATTFSRNFQPNSTNDIGTLRHLLLSRDYVPAETQEMLGGQCWMETIQDSLALYEAGALNAFHVEVRQCGEEPEGSRSQVEFTFKTSTRHISVVISMIESFGRNGLEVDHVLKTASHWFHLNGAPISHQLREAVFDAFAETASRILQGELQFDSFELRGLGVLTLQACNKLAATSAITV